MKRPTHSATSRLTKLRLQKIKILIVDDHKLVREGLRALLKEKTTQFNFQIEEARTGEEAIEKVKRYNFDIVLMDYQLPNLNGAETTREILIHKPYANVLTLSNYDEQLIINSFQKVGAKGYVLKNVETGELIEAITTILNGGKYYCNEISTLMHERSFRKNLCEREYNILEMIAQSQTSRQIADKLCLSKRTIDKYRGQLLRKMQVRNTAGLLIQAKKHKLID